MPSYTLVIANKNYSSWSMRAWLVLKATSAPFREVVIPLRQENSKNEILRYSPSGFLPVLLIDGFTPVHDSLAIAETLAERHPEAKLWPEAPPARAHARSISAEMHSGFMALRAQHPMNMKKREVKPPLEEVQAQIKRIEQIWREAQEHYGNGGDFLYGKFTIADAMYAPVVSRFLSYGISVSAESRRYMQAIEHLPPFQEWYQAALNEPWVI